MVFNANLFAPSGGEQAEYTKVKSIHFQSFATEQKTVKLFDMKASPSENYVLTIKEFWADLGTDPSIGNTQYILKFNNSSSLWVRPKISDYAAGTYATKPGQTSFQGWILKHRTPQTLNIERGRIGINNTSYTKRTPPEDSAIEFFTIVFNDAEGSPNYTIGEINLQVEGVDNIFTPVLHNADKTLGFLEQNTKIFYPIELPYPTYKIYANFAE